MRRVKFYYTAGDGLEVIMDPVYHLPRLLDAQARGMRVYDAKGAYIPLTDLNHIVIEV